MTKLAQLDGEQRKVLNTIMREGRRRKVSFPELVAAVSTGLVEAGLHNPNYGDGSSVGWRQETASSYPNVNRRDVKGSVNRFFNETAQNKGRYHNYAGLAQSVQRSAFPGRYAEHGGEAKDLIRQWSRTHGGGGGGAAKAPGGATSKTVTVKPAVDNSATRSALLMQYLGSRSSDASKDSGNLLNLGLGLKDAQDQPAVTKTIKTPARRPQGTPNVPGTTTAKGVVKFDGKPVAAWIAPILKYARAHGWKGSVTSGYRSYAKQQYLYNHPQGYPVAKPGTSKHEGSDYPRGAVDVSNAAQLASILDRSPYKGKLVWAGDKDAVHFSHPHGGSY